MDDLAKINAEMIAKKINKKDKLFRTARESEIGMFLMYILIAVIPAIIHFSGVKSDSLGTMITICNVLAILYITISRRINALVSLLEDFERTEKEKKSEPTL